MHAKHKSGNSQYFQAVSILFCCLIFITNFIIYIIYHFLSASDLFNFMGVKISEISQNIIYTNIIYIMTWKMRCSFRLQ